MSQPKRGRGRPRKETPAIINAKIDKLKKQALEPVGKLINIDELSEAAKSYQGPAMAVPSEKLYPPANLSKTEKLAWLTENRRK